MLQKIVQDCLSLNNIDGTIWPMNFYSDNDPGTNLNSDHAFEEQLPLVAQIAKGLLEGTAVCEHRQYGLCTDEGAIVSFETYTEREGAESRYSTVALEYKEFGNPQFQVIYKPDGTVHSIDFSSIGEIERAVWVAENLLKSGQLDAREAEIVNHVMKLAVTTKKLIKVNEDDYEESVVAVDSEAMRRAVACMGELVASKSAVILRQRDFDCELGDGKEIHIVEEVVLGSEERSEATALPELEVIVVDNQARIRYLLAYDSEGGVHLETCGLDDIEGGEAESASTEQDLAVKDLWKYLRADIPGASPEQIILDALMSAGLENILAEEAM